MLLLAGLWLVHQVFYPDKAAILAWLFPLSLGSLMAILNQAIPAPPLETVVSPRPVILRARVAGVWERQDYRWVQLHQVTDLGGKALLPAKASLLTIPHASSAAIQPGDQVQARGRLVQEARGWRLEAALLETRKRGPPWSWQRLRQSLRLRWQQQLHPADAGLAIALVLGERGGVPEWHQEAYRQFGLIHLLAVSGMHLWLWDALFRRLLSRRLRIWRWPLLFVMTALAGGKPPVMRALSALLLRDFAHARGWRVAGLRLWSCAWAWECLVLSQRQDDLGFLLSYSATFFLIVGAGKSTLPVWRKALRASWVAFLGSMPLLHAVQSTVEPWSILLSPLLGLLLPFRLVASMLALLPGGSWMAQGCLLAFRKLEHSLFQLSQGLPWSPWLCPQQSSLLLGLAALGGLAFLVLPQRYRRRRWPCLGLALASMVLRFPSSPSLVLVQSGHGLAVLIAGKEQTLLFDCGSASRAPRDLVDRALLPTLHRHSLVPPQHVLLSHPDEDHVNALPALSQRLDYREFAIPEESRRIHHGFRPWTVEVLGVAASVKGVSNDGGHVLSLHMRGRRVVVLGDQEGHSLRELTKRIAPGPIDVLVIPHHGLSTDGLAELLRHLQPQEAWASCGAEDLPLPAAPLLHHMGIPLRTTLEGNLLWKP